MWCGGKKTHGTALYTHKPPVGLRRDNTTRTLAKNITTAVPLGVYQVPTDTAGQQEQQITKHVGACVFKIKHISEHF